MSAWLCSPIHLSILVDAIHEFDLDPGSDKEETYAMLHLENERSLLARYGSPLSTDHTGYVTPPEVTPEDVFKLSHSYDYQSCEHAAWEISAARSIVEELGRKYLTLWGCTEDEAWARCDAAEARWSI